MKNLAPVFLVFALALTSCTSVEKFVDRGNYEEAIRLAEKRLSGKDKKNPRYVAVLETAVNKATHRDLQRAERLTQAPDPDWAEIHAVYDKIDRRQRALLPFLPLVDKNGREARFRLVELDGLLTESNDRAADQYYQDGLAALVRGRSGDKLAARDAFYHFTDVNRHRPDFRDAEGLRREARELGKIFVNVTTRNESGSFLPRGFEEELLRLDARNMDDEWRFYDLYPREGVDYDYDARIVIRDIQVSPERLTERSYLDERTITDGTEYVLDANGNVAKDSLGNDITRPRRIVVRAEVTEVLQQKVAYVSGSLLLYENRTGRLLNEEAITAEADWNNYASTFRGDRRALSRNTRRYIGNRPRQFPTDETLILDAADRLKPELQRLLARSRGVI